MGNKRRKRLILCLLLITMLVAAVTVLPGHAETYPDISKLGDLYLLPDKQQIFHGSDGGYAVVSTDSSFITFVTLLDQNGEPACSEPITIPLPYEKAAVCGEFLYLAGNASSPAHSVQIFRINLTDRSIIMNRIVNISCDFTRGFFAQESGRLYLVTVPYGSEPTSSSPFWGYSFHPDISGSNCIGTPDPDFVPGAPSQPSEGPSSASFPSESENISSGSSSSPADSSLNSSSGAPSDSSDTKPYHFSGPVTVEELQRQLDAEGRGGAVRVTSPNGSAMTGGNVGTGSIVEVLLNGRVDSRIAAVIPGDLTGTGVISEQDSQLLYEHVTRQKELSGLYLQAADLNEDGEVDTSDMLQIKNRIKSLL